MACHHSVGRGFAHLGILWPKWRDWDKRCDILLRQESHGILRSLNWPVFYCGSSGRPSGTPGDHLLS